MSDEHKAKGNAAFQAKNFKDAIMYFTSGIEVDKGNHVLYSNRSACHASLFDWQEAFEDARKCVEIKPDWAKGYARLGASLHGMKKYGEAVEAYQKGLTYDKENVALANGLKMAMAAKDPHPLGQVFTSQLLIALMQSPAPELVALRNDSEFIKILSSVINDHSLINQYLSDERMTTLLKAVTRPAGSEDDVEAPKPTPAAKKAPEPVKELTPEELEKQTVHKKAEEFKAEGNTHYKAKRFAEAITFYEKALDTEKDNIVYMNNIAAVYLEQKEYEKCQEQCDKAVEKGREVMADFKDMAKALTRKGTCYQKQGDYTNAIKWFNASLLEHRSADTLTKRNKCEAEAKKAADAAYFSEEKCEAARLEGNEKFKAQQYKEAIDLYSEAVKRNPKAHAVYSNRGAAYMKMGAYDDAEKDCKKCLEIEPTFVKAVVRLGHIYFFRKEYHKAMVEYNKGLNLDPENEECKNGKQRTIMKVQQSTGGREAPDAERQQRAMADPEIQAILSDTYMQQVLRELSENPRNIDNYRNSPKVMGNIDKLVAAGIIG
eukprot:TRINITY_DN4302_c5_g1_i1.p1 TRINITY_DN4302_c5_g1~~TRINITY_DN4302_c5_g1_i1.p1  ORF type:complete len:564 (+),score=176.08 TRINITY_DN4302_c5_g1_i1:59-1693(+)